MKMIIMQTQIKPDEAGSLFICNKLDYVKWKISVLFICLNACRCYFFAVLVHKIFIIMLINKVFNLAIMLVFYDYLLLLFYSAVNYICAFITNAFWPFKFMKLFNCFRPAHLCFIYSLFYEIRVEKKSLFLILWFQSIIVQTENPIKV